MSFDVNISILHWEFGVLGKGLLQLDLAHRSEFGILLQSDLLLGAHGVDLPDEVVFGFV